VSSAVRSRWQANKNQARVSRGLPPSIRFANKGRAVNLDSLSAQQLSSVKKQLDEEVEHLTTSYTQLAAAQGKFKECLRCVQTQQASSPSGMAFPAPR